MHCSHCGYAANSEKATYAPLDDAREPEKDLFDVATPGKETITDLSEFLGVGEQDIAKTVFYKADDLKQLVNFLKKLNNIEKVFILGAGSNTLITDNLFDGVVIKLSKNFNNISLLGEDIIIAGSAVLDKALSDFAMNNSLSGFEFLACIP